MKPGPCETETAVVTLTHTAASLGPLQVATGITTGTYYYY